MEHARGQRPVDVRLTVDIPAMLQAARPAGGDKLGCAYGPRGAQLLRVVTGAHPVGAHAVQDDVTGAAFDRLTDPVEGAHPRGAGACRVARILAHAPLPVPVPDAVDADHHAAAPELAAQFPDE